MWSTAAIATTGALGLLLLWVIGSVLSGPGSGASSRFQVEHAVSSSAFGSRLAKEVPQSGLRASAVLAKISKIEAEEEGLAARSDFGGSDDSMGRQEALLVIAHPDDECLFFAPAIVQLRRSGVPVRVLCLTRGNYDGLGDQRERELVASCAELGIPASHVVCLEDPKTQDGMQERWDPSYVAGLVLKHLEDHERVSTVLTFDSSGVSGHPNHISCHCGIKYLTDSAPELLRALERGPPPVFYSLSSSSLLQKYSGALQFWFQRAHMLLRGVPRMSPSVAPPVFSSSAEAETEGKVKTLSALMGVNPPREVRIWGWDGVPGVARGCMEAHVSQFVWFRRLFVVFSSYMTDNHFTLMDWESYTGEDEESDEELEPRGGTTTTYIGVVGESVVSVPSDAEDGEIIDLESDSE